MTGQSDEGSTVDYIGENGNIMIVNPQKHGKDARRIFSFNKVFGTDTSQGTCPLILYDLIWLAFFKEGEVKFYELSIELTTFVQINSLLYRSCIC